MPAEGGYSRAMPLRWLPAFTPKSEPVAHVAQTESEAALRFLTWLREQFERCGRAHQAVLMVADGGFDTLALVESLPRRGDLDGPQCQKPCPVSSARRRCSCQSQIWSASRHSPDRVARPIRVAQTHPYGARTRPPFTSQGQGPLASAWGCPSPPLSDCGARQTSPGLPTRSPALSGQCRLDEHGSYQLPLPLETLLFWMWQRWEVEVCHRELKSNFGLGNKQCWNPHAAVTSVQWSAWVYSLLLLAGYRAWGLSRAPDVPTRWWRGAQRWSLNTLWRAFRAELWGQHDFHPLCTPTPYDWGRKEARLIALRNAVFASARS